MTFENQQNQVYEVKSQFSTGLRDVKNASAVILFQIINQGILELSNEVLCVPPPQGAAKLDIIKV